MASTNNTSSDAITTGSAGHLIDVKTTLIILRVFEFGLYPAFSLIGIVGNIISIVIVSRIGLKKSSNILILALAAADAIYLIGHGDVTVLIYYYAGPSYGFYMPEEWSLFMFSLSQIAVIFNNVGSFCSMTFPVLITVDRVIAVFLPLKYNSIVTRRRTIAAIVFLAAFFLSIASFAALWTDHRYFQGNGTEPVGRFVVSNIYFDHKDAVNTAFNPFLNAFTGILPTTIVSCGCIMLLVKVKAASRLRLKMTSSSANEKGKRSSSSRTTKILLAVCIVYSFSSMFTYFVDHFLILQYRWELILYLFRNLVLILNSACNFFIYVGFNKNFRLRPKKVRISSETSVDTRTVYSEMNTHD